MAARSQGILVRLGDAEQLVETARELDIDLIVARAARARCSGSYSAR